MRFFEGLQRKRVLRHIPRSSYSRPFYLKKEKKLKDAVQLIYADLAWSCGIRTHVWCTIHPLECDGCVVRVLCCIRRCLSCMNASWCTIPPLECDPSTGWGPPWCAFSEDPIPNFLKHVQVLFRGTGIIYFSVSKCQIKVYASWLSV